MQVPSPEGPIGDEELFYIPSLNRTFIASELIGFLDAYRDNPRKLPKRLINEIASAVEDRPLDLEASREDLIDAVIDHIYMGIDEEDEDFPLYPSLTREEIEDQPIRHIQLPTIRVPVAPPTTGTRLVSPPIRPVSPPVRPVSPPIRPVSPPRAVQPAPVIRTRPVEEERFSIGDDIYSVEDLLEMLRTIRNNPKMRTNLTIPVLKTFALDYNFPLIGNTQNKKTIVERLIELIRIKYPNAKFNLKIQSRVK